MKVLGRILALLVFISLLFILVLLAMPKVPYKAGFYVVAFDVKSGQFVDIDTIGRYDLRRLNPFTLRIYQVDNSYTSIHISSTGSLGSPEFFNSNKESIDKDIFDFNIKMVASLKLKEEKILDYLNSKKLAVNNIADFYASQEKKLKSLSKSFIEESVLINNGTLGTQSQFEELLLAYLQKAMSDFHFDSLVVEQMKLPNFTLYKQMLDITLSDLINQNNAKQAAKRAIAENYANLEERLKILEEYGKVLSKYPVLVPFFMANNNKFFTLAEIQSLMPSAGSDTSNNISVPPSSTSGK